MEKEYLILRNLEINKDYENIYEQLKNEIKNINVKTMNIQDVTGIKAYIDNELKQKIFKKKGLPSFLVKIIILLGSKYEEEMQETIANYISSTYVTDFQLYSNREFNKLADIKKYYDKMQALIKTLNTVYYNLPEKWNIKNDIVVDIYSILKQRICNIIFFNEHDIDDYCECVDFVIKNEKTILQLFTNIKKSVFCLLAPLLKPYYAKKIEQKMDYKFDSKNTSCKIYANIISFFENIESLYENSLHFKVKEAIKILTSVFEENFTKLLNSMANIKLDYNYDIDECRDYNTNDFEIIVMTLNTISYLNECIADINSNLYCDFELNLSQEVFVKVGNLENKYNSMLEIYIRNILIDINFYKSKFSAAIVKKIKNNIFYLDFSSLYEDLKINIIEVIILQILSRLYYIDFDEETAEEAIYELHDLKLFLEEHNTVLGGFNILEAYLKIFMCSPENVETFILNFKMLSNNIFNFKQIVWSLKDKNAVIRLLEFYEENENFKNAELSKY